MNDEGKIKYWDCHSQLNLHLDNETYNQLRDEAIRDDRTMSWVARKYLKIGINAATIEKSDGIGYKIAESHLEGDVQVVDKAEMLEVSLVGLSIPVEEEQ